MKKRKYVSPELEEVMTAGNVVLASGDAMGWDKDVIGNDVIDWFGGNV